jgi:mannan endo-1,4-beta-mannosidase
VLKCTPLSGGFNPDICMANSPSTPTTPTPPPVPTTPPPTRWKTLNYLYSIRGRGTVAGMHERYSQTPSRFTEQARQVSGKYPGLWSGDFLFDYNRQYRQNMIDEAKRRWNAGTMINIMYHSCNPATANVGEECNYNDNYKGPWSKMSDSDWQAIITDGSGLNQKWKQYLDEISPYLLDLKNNGVEVLFRPFHEMNQGAFWWGGRPGASGTRRLYQISHDYLTNVKRLDNLIWVWNIQDFGSLGNDAQSYNPGSNYYEVASLDVYEGMQTWKYDVMRNVAGGKPIAIGECDVLPDASRLVSESLWTFFMSWSELTFEKNTGDKITSVYNQAITRDEMGDWQGGTITPPTTSPPSPTTPPPSPPTTGLGDWELCSSNSQCMNGCCSGMYSANVLKCTPLSGGFNPDICMANTPTTPSTSSKPTTTRPSTRKPTLTSGGSAKPTTRKPTTRKPTTRKPTQVPTNEPTTESPTTNAPTTDSPTTDSPTTESPTTQSPATESPTTESPTTESPTTSQPTSKPTSAKPTTRKPSTRKPTTRKPSTRKPTTGKPIL